MYKLFNILPAIIVTGLYYATPATAQARELTCYSSEFAPYVIAQENAISGIDVEVIAQAGKRAGLEIKFRLLPWVRLENEIRRGEASEVECAFAYTFNDTRKTYMDFSQVPVKTTQYLLFSQKGRFHGPHLLQELRGKSIGLRRGFVVPGEFENLRRQQEFNIQEVEDDLTNFRKLELGRIDAIVANAEVGRNLLRQLQNDKLVAMPTPIVEIKTFLVFNKGKKLAALLPAFDHALTSMQQDGSIQKIRDKYLKPEPKQD